MTRRRALKIDPLWTSAYLTDQLVINLCEKEQILSADIVKELSIEIFDSGRGISILKYPAEFLHTAHLISVSNFTSFPPFRIDQRDLGDRVLSEILSSDKKSQDLIIMDVIKRDELLYIE